MFERLQQGVPAFPVASTGAAVAKLYNANVDLRRAYPELRDEISYLTLMRSLIGTAKTSRGNNRL
jgi:hypothetical protein